MSIFILDGTTTVTPFDKIFLLLRINTTHLCDVLIRIKCGALPKINIIYANLSRSIL